MESKKKFLANRHKRIPIIVLGAIILVVVAAGIIYYSMLQQRAAETLAEQQAQQEAQDAEIKKQQDYIHTVTNSNTFCEGVSVGGVAIGGLTMEEAKAALLAALPGNMIADTLTLTYLEKEYTLDLSAVSIFYNVDEVLSEAFLLARSGTYDSLTAELEDIRVNGRAYTLTETFDYAALSEQITAIAASIDRAVVEPTVSITTSSDKKIEFVAGVNGVAVRQSELLSLVTDAISKQSNAPIAIPYDEILPGVSQEELEASYVLRGTANTSFKTSNSNRKYNINKGAALINGTVLKPGETFSANTVLGPRTQSNGWKLAGAYVMGAVEEQYGGGVCQLSSTLYNAAVKADLQIVYRRNHSMPVGYVSRGLDATINTGTIDFQFRNNTDADIVIFARTVDTTLYMDIYGAPFATDEYDEIRLSSEFVETVKPSGEMVITLDETKAPGYSEVVIERQNGSIYQSYKEYYKDGKLVRKEKLATSTYRAYAGETIVGPEASPSPSPSVTPEASNTPAGTATPTPTAAPTAEATSTPAPTATPAATATAETP